MDGSVADLSAYRPVLAEVGSRLIHIGDHRQGSDFAIGDSYGLRHGRRAGVAPSAWRMDWPARFQAAGHGRYCADSMSRSSR